MRVDLRGLIWSKVNGRTYYYAWRDGPRLRGEPGMLGLVASYNEAVVNRSV